MKKFALPLLVLAFAAAAFAGDDDNQAANRVKSASAVLEEIQAAPDTGIPDEVMGSADCVAVVPSMLKAGFVFGLLRFQVKPQRDFSISTNNKQPTWP